MGFFTKSKCSTCLMCDCCCASEVTVTTRKYTYENLYNWENSFVNSDFLAMPVERIDLKGEDEKPNLFYHQIDTEFYARNINDSIPLVSYANGPFFKKSEDCESEISKYSLPTISYVADPVYIRRSEKCKCGNSGSCCSCNCFCATN